MGDDMLKHTFKPLMWLVENSSAERAPLDLMTEWKLPRSPRRTELPWRRFRAICSWRADSTALQSCRVTVQFEAMASAMLLRFTGVTGAICA